VNVSAPIRTRRDFMIRLNIAEAQQHLEDLVEKVT